MVLPEVAVKTRFSLLFPLFEVGLPPDNE